MVSAVFMILALAWLTVSTPFVYKGQQYVIAAEKKAQSTSQDDKNDEESNPFANTTEEKTSGGNTIAEEYLHHTDEPLFLVIDKPGLHLSHSYDVYIAFHGELHCPPPNRA